MAENCNFVWSLDHEPKTKPANSVKKTRLFLIYTYQYVCKLEINVHVLSWYCRWYTPACFDISYHIHGFLLCSIHVYLCKRRIMFHMWIKLILRSCGVNKPCTLTFPPSTGPAHLWWYLLSSYCWCNGVSQGYQTWRTFVNVRSYRLINPSHLPRVLLKNSKDPVHAGKTRS